MRTRSHLAALTALAALGCRATPADPAPHAGRVPSSDGVEIAYTARGAGEPPLVFVHGWACDQSSWAEQVEVFAARHRVVTLDLGGHGASGAGRETWDMPAFAGDVVAVVEALDLDGVVLVGHSLGGPVALLAAARMPERVALVVGADTLHDCSEQLDPEMVRGLVEQLEADYAATLSGFVRAVAGGLDAEWVERIEAGALATPPAVAVGVLRSYDSYDPRATLAGSPVAVHVVNSDANPTDVEGNRRILPAFDATFLPGAGHWVMLERAEEFNAILARLLLSPGSAGPRTSAPRSAAPRGRRSP